MAAQACRFDRLSTQKNERLRTNPAIGKNPRTVIGQHRVNEKPDDFVVIGLFCVGLSSTRLNVVGGCRPRAILAAPQCCSIQNS